MPTTEQIEKDELLNPGQGSPGGVGPVVPFDFQRPDRIARSLISVIQTLHEAFVRELASSLSAYLRSNVSVSLVSVEQLTFSEFLDCLPSPTCAVSIGLEPCEGTAVLEINPSLLFPIIEILLGGDGKLRFTRYRELTEIEQMLLDGLFRLILRDLRNAWSPVAEIGFDIGLFDTGQTLRAIPRSDAVVAIAIELAMGEATGMLNLAIPSIAIKMLRQRFESQSGTRRRASTDSGRARVANLIRKARLASEALLEGPGLTLRELMALEPGQVLGFEYPVGKPLTLLLNGHRRYLGQLVADGSQAAFRITGVLDDAGM